MYPIALRAAAVAAGCMLALCSEAAAPPAANGPAAVLSRQARPAAVPERSLLLSVARAGNRLVAVGEHGVVTLSDNNGASWRNARKVPVDVTLTAVRFANDKTGWAVGHIGVVLRTDDGGETWVKQLDGLAAARLAPSGATPAEDAPDRPLLDLLVRSERHIIAVGAFNLALESLDGGATWKNISERFVNNNGFHLYGLVLSGDSLLAVGEQGLLLRSQAAGPFSALKSPYQGSLFGGIAVGPDAALVYGLKGHVFLSNDKGENWQAVDSGNANASVNCAARLSDGRIALCSQAGRVFISNDGGKRFSQVDFEWGAPLTAMAESAAGDLIVTSLGGIVKIDKSKLAADLRGNGGNHGR